MVATLKFLMPISDLNAIDGNGRDALMKAAEYGRREVIMALLAHFSTDAKDRGGLDALAIARQTLSSGCCETPEQLRETIDFLAAYKHSMREMASLSTIEAKSLAGETIGSRTARI